MTTTKRPAKMARKKAPGDPIKVAILGFGTVGSSVARVLAAGKYPGLQLTHIYNRDVERKRLSNAAKYVPAAALWTENINDVLTSKVDIIVELMGGLKPTEAWIRTALASGKSVVTANKQLVAYRGASLLRLAKQHSVQLIHGAAVAGGVPVIPGLLHGQSADHITRVRGILNGTCNYMLTRMEAGAGYAEVLADAQALGYAEADPSADVDGFDARAKLCILSRIALQAELDPDQVPAQTISTIEKIDFMYAKELGCTIRQVSTAQLDSTRAGAMVQARVGPMLIPHTSPMAWSHGTQNMVVASGRFGGDVVFSGRGAGGEPTAVAVVSDLLAIAQGGISVELPVHRRRVTGDFISPHYLRFVVNDRPGIVSSIARSPRQGRSQHRLHPSSVPATIRHALPFVVTTEPCLNSTIDKAVEAMAKMNCMLEPPLCLQMLEPEPANT